MFYSIHGGLIVLAFLIYKTFTYGKLHLPKAMVIMVWLKPEKKIRLKTQ